MDCGRVPADVEIYKEGDPSTEFFIVLSGEAEFRQRPTQPHFGLKATTPPGEPDAVLPTPMTTMPPDMAMPLQHQLGRLRVATTAPVSASRTWATELKTWQLKVNPPA